MKRCPFCAEEIQDAAIVCKHCGRDLLPVTKAKPRGGRIALVVVALLALAVAALYFAADSLQFREFEERRAAWHERCDVYLQTPLTNPSAAQCNRELNDLVAYGKQQGWVD